MYAVRTTLLALLLAATPALANTTAEAHPLPPGISWVQGDVDAAFAAAKAANKPVFLYWGAGWCPPCNQVKATIFNQQGFIERSKFFVPVYLDGDSPSAQKWGEKFKVVGYPTMILFRPDGTEVMRLPGEAEADRYMRALSLGMNAIHPIAQTLATALKGDKVSADEWQMLADYSWDTDEAQLVPPARLALTLQTLTRNVPAELPGTALRLQLKAVVAAATAQVPQQIDKAGSKVAIDKVLADSKLSREDFDIVVNFPTDVTSYLTKADSDDRKALVAAWDKALAALSADGTISTADRMSAVIGRVSLAQLDAPKDAKLPDTLLKAVRDQVADADAHTTNGYERHAVITAAADALSTAGLLDESDKLLNAELKRSHSPYYLMLELASNARQRGDKATALNWYEQAYNAAEGPATRLQWGVSYVGGVIELAPQDEGRLEKAATSVLAEVEHTPNAFYERSRRSLERLVKRLGDWNKNGDHAAVVQRVFTQLEGVCSKLPASDPQRGVCEGLVKQQHKTAA